MVTVTIESASIEAMYDCTVEPTSMGDFCREVVAVFNGVSITDPLREEDLEFEVYDETSSSWLSLKSEHMKQSKLHMRITESSSGREQPLTDHPKLRPLKMHLAALRITAFLRASSRILRDVHSCAAEVYREMGWGWTEKAYQEAIKMELDMLGYRVISEVPHTIYYKGRPLGEGVCTRIDIIAEDRYTWKQVLIELKSVPPSKAAMDKAKQQCRRYLRLTGYPVGVVINFPQQASQCVQTAHILL